MALTVNTNVASLNAQRNLNVTSNQLSKSLERLSSGLRINRAGDDAAGLAISENMRASIRSMNQAMRNANDGVSMLQTAEGALNETANILIRMRELAEQSASGTVGSDQRTAINNEFTQLKSEIDRIASVTEFNGTKLLNSSQSVDLQIGAKNTTADKLTISLKAAFASSIGAGTSSVDTQASAQTALDNLDTAINSVSSQRGDLGSYMNRLQSTINNLQVAVENTSAAESRIRDVDVASETASMTRAQVLVQAGTAILAQANQTPQAALSLLR